VNDFEVQAQSVLASLSRESRISLYLVGLGAAFLIGSVYYAASRLTPLEREIAEKQELIAKLAEEEQAQRKRLAEAKLAFDTLRASTERLYAVRITPSNQVYEVKATAIATGKKLPSGRPEYRFSIFINSPKETLDSIARVAYQFKHEAFKNQEYVSTEASNQFRQGYVGWGCLSNVKIAVTLKTGTSHEFDFDMCRSLGPEWN